MAVVFVAAFSLVIGTHAGVTSTNQKTTKSMSASVEFYGNIIFNVFEDDGCRCAPFQGVQMNTIRRDTDHSISGITNEGTCIPALEDDKTYRRSIQEQRYESVLFDFVVIDDQTFSNHMKAIQASISYFSFIHLMSQKLFQIKQGILV